MNKPVKETITPAEFNSIVTQRIRALGETWNKMLVNDRFWMVFNWLKAYQIVGHIQSKRQLFVVKPYWQEPYQERGLSAE